MFLENILYTWRLFNHLSLGLLYSSPKGKNDSKLTESEYSGLNCITVRLYTYSPF